MEEFVGFPKIARLHREVIVTEKLDGTNAQICIQTMEEADIQPFTDSFSLLLGPGEAYRIWTGSRKRWITPANDNHGFSKWVLEHLEEIVKLGPGRHFGEWWGHGINHGYGLKEKRFSLFNVSRWADDTVRPASCYVVPVIARGDFNDGTIGAAMEELRINGSRAAPGYMKPEGIVIFHTASNSLFKKTLEHDDVWKGQRSE